MREPGKARSEREAARFAQVIDGEDMVDLPKDSELLEQRQAMGTVKIEDRSISLDGDQIWLTNPYGLDCSFQPSSIEGCEAVLRWIASDTHEREWGSL